MYPLNPEKMGDPNISVNFSLKTNERYINEMEKTRPLKPEDLDLIRESFKPEYAHPIETWALVATDSRRNKLYTFLRGDLTEDKRPMTARIFQPTHRERNLVTQTPRGSIDFNRGIHGETHSKKVNLQKFESKGIHDDGIFGYAEPYTPRPPAPSHLALFVAKKLLRPAAVARVEDTVEAQFKFLTELLKWVEKKGNTYVVDQLRNDPVLSPHVEMQEIKRKDLEDHMYSTKHHFYKPHPPARSLRHSERFKTNYVSNYQASFCDDLHQNIVPRIEIPFKPSGHNCPFAAFPEIHEPLEIAHNPLIESQVCENRTSGRLNFRVFNSQTCL